MQPVAFAGLARDRSETATVVATRLVTARRRAGLSLVEVANSLGRSRNTVADWECGRTSPSAVDLATLIDLYRCSADWILGADVVSGFAAMVDRRCERFLRSTESLDDFLARLPTAMIVLHEEIDVERNPAAYAKIVRELLDREEELREPK